jgi:hypothetical protein
LIIAHNINKNGELKILIALSRQNCDLLLEGKPIFKGPESTRVPMTIIIVGGETEEKILDELQSNGFEFGTVIDDRPKGQPS